MSMNQSAIMTFLGKPRARVMLDTSYAQVFGKTPGRLATMMRHEPDMITGGTAFAGNTMKAKAHAAALRALVREKSVSVKVVHEKGSLPMVAITKKTMRGQKGEDEETTITAVRRGPGRPRKHPRPEDRPKRKYTRRAVSEGQTNEAPAAVSSEQTSETPMIQSAPPSENPVVETKVETAA